MKKIFVIFCLVCIVSSVSSVSAGLFDDDTMTIDGISFDTPSGSENVHSLDIGTGSFVLKGYTCMVSSMSEEECEEMLDGGYEEYDTFGFSKIFKATTDSGTQLFMVFKQDGGFFRATVLPSDDESNDLDDMKQVLTRFCSVNPTTAIL